MFAIACESWCRSVRAAFAVFLSLGFIFLLVTLGNRRRRNSSLFLFARLFLEPILRTVKAAVELLVMSEAVEGREYDAETKVVLRTRFSFVSPLNIARGARTSELMPMMWQDAVRGKCSGSLG